MINSVFICLSTYAFVLYMKFKPAAEAKDVQQKRLHQAIATTVVIVVVPSLFLAYFLQQKSLFTSRANAFIKNEMRFERSFVVDREILFSWGVKKISASVIGESLTEMQIETLRQKMTKYSLAPELLTIRQASIEENLEKRMQERFNTESSRANDYQIKLTQRDLELQNYRNAEDLTTRVTEELRPLAPGVRQVIVMTKKAESGEFESRVLVQWKGAPRKDDVSRVTRFLEQRVQTTENSISHSRDI